MGKHLVGEQVGTGVGAEFGQVVAAYVTIWNGTDCAHVAACLNNWGGQMD